MKAYITMQKGKGKLQSEDRVLIDKQIFQNGSALLNITNIPAVVAIADGVGGNAGGSDAAQFVVEALAELKLAEHELNESFILAELHRINEALIKAAKNINKEQMATTLSGIVFCNQKAYAFHIGNTRIFAVQGGYLRQTTKDHTTKEWLNSIGQHHLAEQYNKSEITGCLGGGDVTLASSIQTFIIDNWNQFRGWVLTSDGIHDYVREDELDILCVGIKQAEDVCTYIMQDAIDNGSVDDRSIVLIRNE